MWDPHRSAPGALVDDPIRSGPTQRPQPTSPEALEPSQPLFHPLGSPVMTESQGTTQLSQPSPHVSAPAVGPAEPKLYQLDLGQYIKQRNVAKPITGLEFDVSAEFGQARRLDTEVVDSHAECFRHQLPKDRLKVTLWPTDAIGMPPNWPPTPSCPPPPLAQAAN